jgi:hypothetical protein
VADDLAVEVAVVKDERRVPTVDKGKLDAAAVALRECDGVAASDRLAFNIPVAVISSSDTAAPNRGASKVALLS